VKEECTDFYLDCPKKVEGIPFIKKSVCGDAHSVLLSEDGDVFVFGFSYQGQLGMGITGDSDVFQIF
jgi:alpha-tubulin suppressor-like RCC1 family protein